ncbi:hypothetical protein GCM10011391_04490 [Pullulanibacillus camelliae]|uniref:Uncharacterized protein n=1 Tax=Pullulanibacillus camelliae TaxID=1707096 RepID=A0A8J2YEQ4_9BACL|nr:hypothetical protein [Pullulanibacillus camelliae]GGE29059.1 hypothetical protein GCM10011391_04490 [Pullulanibacillus camelliae]
MDKKGKPLAESKKPTIANGIDNDEELEAEATDEEIRRGESTTVTKLIYDEYDPSPNQ